MAGVDELAAEVRLLHLGIPDPVHRAGENVLVKDDQVGELTFSLTNLFPCLRTSDKHY